MFTFWTVWSFFDKRPMLEALMRTKETAVKERKRCKRKHPNFRFFVRKIEIKGTLP